jgi:hypothetical protein
MVDLRQVLDHRVGELVHRHQEALVARLWPEPLETGPQRRLVAGADPTQAHL